MISNSFSPFFKPLVHSFLHPHLFYDGKGGQKLHWERPRYFFSFNGHSVVIFIIYIVFYLFLEPKNSNPPGNNPVPAL